MPSRGQDGLYNQAERRLRDATIVFENGNRLEMLGALNIETEEPEDMQRTSVGAQEAHFTFDVIGGGVDLSDIQETIEGAVAARQRERESELQRLMATHKHISSTAQLLTSTYGASFMEILNAVWGDVGDDFELADEEEYVVTDPMSFDELMGGVLDDD